MENLIHESLYFVINMKRCTMCVTTKVDEVTTFSGDYNLVTLSFIAILPNKTYLSTDQV